MHGLGLHFDKEAHPIQQLQEQLADQSRLIILDNFEHLLPPPQLDFVHLGPFKVSNIRLQTGV